MIPDQTQAPEAAMQRLDLFALPRNFRGRPAWFVQLWWIVQSTAFALSPQVAYGFRRALLRLFGAKVGRGVLIRPTAKITFPWKLSIGDYCWIGDDVVLYSLGHISIGAHTTVSQRSYVCAADHDMASEKFDIRARPISIGKGCWAAADVFVGPGVSIGDGTVVGARSSVFRDLPSGTVCMGTPCVVVKRRQIRAHTH